MSELIELLVRVESLLESEGHEDIAGEVSFWVDRLVVAES